MIGNIGFIHGNNCFFVIVIDCLERGKFPLMILALSTLFCKR
jgi:hypothetical protein